MWGWTLETEKCMEKHLSVLEKTFQSTDLFNLSVEFGDTPPFASSISFYFKLCWRNFYIKDKNPILNLQTCLWILDDKMVYHICKNFLWEHDCSAAVNDPYNSVQNHCFLFLVFGLALSSGLQWRIFVSFYICKIAVWY